MKNLVLAVTMEAIYQVIKRDVPLLTRQQCYRDVPGFPGLCWLAFCDPESAKKRFWPQ